MLKISTIETKSGTKALQLSGSISGAWVQELQDCCERWLEAGNAVTLDLKDVDYADASGLELLSVLKSRQVSVIRWTPLVARLLDAHESQNSELAGERGKQNAEAGATNGQLEIDALGIKPRSDVF